MDDTKKKSGQTTGSFATSGGKKNLVPYNELELYLMGMIPVSSVKDFDNFFLDIINSLFFNLKYK